MAGLPCYGAQSPQAPASMDTGLPETEPHMPAKLMQSTGGTIPTLGCSRLKKMPTHGTKVGKRGE